MKKPIILFSLFILPANGSAQSFQDLSALDAQIAEKLYAQSGHSGGSVAPIDRRLKLAKCPQEVMIEPMQSGAIAVRCNSLGWRIRVPVVLMPSPMNSSVKMVHRGDAVELIIAENGFDISTGAVSMDDGGLGQQVRVKTLTGKNPVIASVKNIGQVSINR